MLRFIICEENLAGLYPRNKTGTSSAVPRKCCQPRIVAVRKAEHPPQRLVRGTSFAFFLAKNHLGTYAGLYLRNCIWLGTSVFSRDTIVTKENKKYACTRIHARQATVCMLFFIDRNILSDHAHKCYRKVYTM